MLNDYYKRFDPQKNYEKLLFRPGKGLQSAELNDLQEQYQHQLHSIADSVLKDGDVIRGGSISINLKTGETHIEEASVYLRGYLREIVAQDLVIPTDDTFYIGVWLIERVITEIEDPALKDPATGTHNYQQPGAARLQVLHTWGLKTDKSEGTFYPVFRIDNGVHITNEPPPQLDSITVAIARFDRESNGGSYVVEGMEVIDCGYQGDKQVVCISEGKSHIDGFTVEFTTALRKLFDVDPDMQGIVSEPHIFKPDAEKKMRVDLSFAPIDEESLKVDGTLQVEETITHGSYSGVMDPLQNTSVEEIVSVEQAGNLYKEGKDYKLTKNTVDWSLEHDEPAPGSTYTVIYRYSTRLTLKNVDEKGFTVENVVAGTKLRADYQWKMPRVDLITVDKEGVVRRLKGIPNPYRPQVPRVPTHQFSLAEIRQIWSQLEAAEVTNHAVRTVSMSELKLMQEQISDLYDLVAIERLKNDANMQDPTVKKGVFVDPFFDDDMRDQGIEQTAAIIDGELVLPILVDIADLGGFINPITLAYEDEVIINQPMHTGSMKVNPYQAFEPIPPKATLYPQVDRWTQTQTRWLSSITRRFWVRNIRRSNTQVRVEQVRTRTEQAEFLRPRGVRYIVSGFGYGEPLSEILFDGINLPCDDIVADDKGIVRGTFQIPKNIPAGTKSVVFIGKVVSRAETTYTGRGTITIREQRNVITTWRRSDPLAQTFTLDESRHLSGVDLWFTKAGAADVRVQVRETALGLPTQEVLSEAIIKRDEINIDGSHTAIRFSPVFLDAGVEYAVVILTDDPDYEVQIAELSKFDLEKGWVTRQPYQIGVLLSSSNAVTWTPHQNSDLTFRLVAAKFKETSRVLNFGTLESENISDLMVLASVQRTSSATDLRFMITDQTNQQKYEIHDNQVVSLAHRITGDVAVEAHFVGSDKHSPVLYQGTQLAQGKLQETADYVSRSITCTGANKLSVTLESFSEGQSGVEVYYQVGEQWEKMTNPIGQPVGDNWVEQKYTQENISQESTRIKLLLYGNAINRARVRGLRVITT